MREGVARSYYYPSLSYGWLLSLRIGTLLLLFFSVLVLVHPLSFGFGYRYLLAGRNGNNPSSLSSRGWGLSAVSDPGQQEQQPQQQPQQQQQPLPNAKPQPRRLVLIGGGHAHAQVIRSLRDRPSDVMVTLVDCNEKATYSGMVPGCVAGSYHPTELQIDLPSLASWSNMEFVHGTMVDLNTTSKEITIVVNKTNTSNGDTTTTGRTNLCCSLLKYDCLSLDIGSTVRGPVPIHALPTRPIGAMVERLDELSKSTLALTRGQTRTNQKVVVVGGGPAGLELAMAVRARWNANVTVVASSSHSTTSTSEEPERRRRRRALAKVLDDRNIRMVVGRAIDVTPKEVVVDVAETTVRTMMRNNETDADANADSDSRQRQRLRLPCDLCLWATGAAPHPLAEILQTRGGVDVTPDGWIRVGPTLQSTSHADIFAAGDCAHLVMQAKGDGDGDGQGQGLPKAGVYAVRAGPVLLENLLAFLSDTRGEGGTIQTPTRKGLKKYVPQTDFLQLLNCGDGTALGFRFGMDLYGPWVWRLKDHIDRLFINLFQFRRHDNDIDNLDLPAISVEDNKTSGMSQYDDVLSRPRYPTPPPDEAAALLRRTDDTVDFEQAWDVIRDMVDDPEYCTQVRTHFHRLSDEVETEMETHLSLTQEM